MQAKATKARDHEVSTIALLRKIMSKSQNSKKSDKKKPLKTKDEKRQAKRDKKDKKEHPGILNS